MSKRLSQRLSELSFSCREMSLNTETQRVDFSTGEPAFNVQMTLTLKSFLSILGPKIGLNSAGLNPCGSRFCP